MKKAFMFVLFLSVQGCFQRVCASGDRQAHPPDAKEQHEGKKTFEEWKKDILGAQSGTPTTFDSDISQDMLEELYNNYKQAK